MSKNIFNISTSNSFYDVLAQKFLEEYKNSPLDLANVLFLLPSRRASQSLRESFLRAFGLKPLILPQMIALYEVDEDEILIKNIDFSQLTTPISKNERLFSFMKMLLAKNGTSLEQAYFLANELGGLLDEAAQYGINFSELKNIVPENFAAHWIETLDFLKIITQFWPQILAEKNKLDIGQHKQQILELQADIWNKQKSQQRIVAAGISAPHLGIKSVLESIRDLPNGEIYFYGIDQHLTADEWDAIPSSHPCFETSKMLSFLEIKRESIIELVAPSNPSREDFVSEIMRPAGTTEKWQNIDPSLKSGLDGISVVECEDIRQEALIIALMMRKELEQDGKTTALITPNRNLARRVCAELKRWKIDVDDSAGRPLHSTAVGNFLRLIIKNCQDDFNIISFLSLAKHPYLSNKNWIKEYEKKVIRQKKEDADLELSAQEFKAEFVDFYPLFSQARINLKTLIIEHIKLAEKLCPKLFNKEEGKAVAKMISSLLENSESLGEINPQEYLKFFDAISSSMMVRPAFATHPRLKILGPIEARFTQFDLSIIGGLNEGSWPLSNTNNPWLSETMKKDLGLSLGVDKTGIMAFDFMSFLCNPQVVLTRSQKVEGTPMIKSRWLLRLETVAKALGVDINKKTEFIYKKLSHLINTPKEYIKIAPAAPCPPVDKRPRQMSASNIELWMRDPYSIYAKYILSLYPLDELEQDLSAADYGNLIHKILETFYKKNPHNFPEDAKEQLLAIGTECFIKEDIDPASKIFWQSRFEKYVAWLCDIEKQYHQDIQFSHSEISDFIELDAPAGKFTISAKADRIDETFDNQLNIIDYKTGQAKKTTEVYAGYAPQLPIEGLIFAQKFAKEIKELIYWQLGKKVTIINKDIPSLLADTKDRLQRLIANFDFQSTPYHSNPNPSLSPKYSDYEHLSRLKEWSLKGDDDE